MYISLTPVKDLSPLRGLPLKIIQMAKTPVRDLSPLEGMPDKVTGSADVLSYIGEGWEKLYGGKMEFIEDPDEMIRKTLEHIDKKRAALKLPVYDATRFGASGDDAMKTFVELPVEQQMAEIYG